MKVYSGKNIPRYPRYIVMKMGEAKNCEDVTADVYIKDDVNTWGFVCDCGDWDNKEARKMARKICKLLNKEDFGI